MGASLASWWNDRSLRAKGLIVFAIPAAAIVLLSSVTLWTDHQANRAGATVESTYRVRHQIDLVIQDLSDTETGVRGYLLTGQYSFLQPYLEAGARIYDDLERLQALARGDPPLAKPAAYLTPLINHRLAWLQRLRDGYPYAKGIAASRLGRGHVLRDWIGGHLDAMEAIENGRLQRARAAASSARAFASQVAIGGGALGLALAALALLLFLRGIVRRIRRNEENAELLERGEPLLDAPGGEDEVARSGRALVAAGELLAERERLLRESSARVRDLYDQAPCGYHSVDAAGVYVLVNETELSWIGYGREELVGKRKFSDVLAEESYEAYGRALAALRREGSVDDVELELIHRNGSRRTVSMSATTVTDEMGRFLMSRTTLFDISERNAYEAELERANAELTQMEDELRMLATVDQLTGLYNLRGFLALAEHELRRSDRERVPVMLIFADLDGLKDANDRFGHEEGNTLLRDAAQALRSAARASDVVARYGGDEFCVLLEGDAEAAETVRSRIDDAVVERNASSTHPFALSMSLGCALHEPGDDVPLAELLRRADAKMYETKTARRHAS